MVKVLLSVMAVGFALGCAAPNDDDDKAAGTMASDPEEPAVGQVQQASQFADATVFNIVDVGASPFLTLLANGDPVTIQIFYVGDKTTDAGHFPSTAVLVDTISLGTDQVRSHVINAAHAAFTGGYGSILVDAIGVSPTNVFQTFMTVNMGTNANVTQSVGGSVFQGASYRIPVFRGSEQGRPRTHESERLSVRRAARASKFWYRLPHHHAPAALDVQVRLEPARLDLAGHERAPARGSPDSSRRRAARWRSAATSRSARPSTASLR